LAEGTRLSKLLGSLTTLPDLKMIGPNSSLLVRTVLSVCTVDWSRRRSSPPDTKTGGWSEVSGEMKQHSGVSHAFKPAATVRLAGLTPSAVLAGVFACCPEGWCYTHLTTATPAHSQQDPLLPQHLLVSHHPGGDSPFENVLRCPSVMPSSLRPVLYLDMSGPPLAVGVMVRPLNPTDVI
jgi:hypothetical protein